MARWLDKNDLEMIRYLTKEGMRGSDIASRLLISVDTVRRQQKALGCYSACRTGMKRGPGHPGWNSGRVMDRDGYILISCQKDFGGARRCYGERLTSRVLEHRVFAEIKIGRKLKPEEVVDHRNGVKFHNDPDNLRVFSSNGEHLKKTITGQCPDWSPQGKSKISLARHYPKEMLRKHPLQIDTHRKRVRSGDERKKQILLGRELLGIRSPWFLGMKIHFENNGIDWPFDQRTERDLSMKHLQMVLAHPELKQWIQG